MQYRKTLSQQPQRKRDEKVLKRKSVLERVDEFRDEMLERRACRNWLREKKSNVAAHVKSMKHLKSKEDR